MHKALIERKDKMQIRTKIFKSTAMLLSASMIGLFTAAEYYSAKLPDTITSETGTAVRIAEFPEITCTPLKGDSVAVSETFPASSKATLALFGAIPVKNVEIREEQAPTLIAGGMPFGIKLLMEGVMVTRLGEVEDVSGSMVCPAREAGIRTGDVIRLIDGVSVASNSQIQDIISGSTGRTLKVTLIRDGKELTVFLDPVFTKSERTWRGGMWVRDSIAGIGTMTFVDKSTGAFAGLGHPICDSDTGETVTISSGEAVPVEITEAVRGEKGIPGELKGKFVSADTLGILCRNNDCGIFGMLSEDEYRALCVSGEEYKMGYSHEAETGSAFIITTVSGTAPKKYDIEIESIDYNGKDSTKNMVIRITDPELLEATGGIVQGMSGSPVIQNNKLIGAVTHVFVADPTRGYAIFAENMQDYT